MKISKLLTIAFLIGLISIALCAQTPQLLKRTTVKTDSFDFGPGGTVAVIGAPIGSVRIEGWSQNRIDISAEIEIQAATDADLAKLAEVTTFILDEGPGRTVITSIGTNNRKNLKVAGKKLPKNLIGLPYSINYVVHVPRYSDLEIDGGKGNLNISGVEGSMRINFIDSDAKIEVIGGNTTATFGSGTVAFDIGTHGWRARSADIQVIKGDLSITLPANVSAEIDALVLRTGAIENTVPDLKQRDRKVAFTDKSIIARAGPGGAPLKFTVGDGTLKMSRAITPK